MAYKKSFIGFSWILVSPIIGIASWVVLNSAGVLQPGDAGIPIPAYILISSSIWGLFMGFYGAASGTLTAGGGIINQVKYPHEALLVKQAAQHLANFIITFTFNIIVLLLFGIIPSYFLLLLPILMIPLLLLGSAIGLVISVLSIVAPDFTNVFNILFGFVFYITPIIYVKDKIEQPLLKSLVEINPLTYLVGGVRDLVIYGRLDRPDLFVLYTFISFILFLLAWRIFYVSEYKAIERMI